MSDKKIDKKALAKEKARRLAMARVPKGFRDLDPGLIITRREMFAKITEVFERYGFQPLETPAVEYVDALGKHLPEADEPAGGIFAFLYDDDEWAALRYDLTAPLARFVAGNEATLPLPYRRYQIGPVWRLEKPGPGRFREFYQCDFDTVGAPDVTADAEACIVFDEVMQALGLKRGEYRIRVNNRKLLTGLLETLGDVTAESRLDEQTATVRILRSMDKFDKVGFNGVRQLLGEGRTDESGDRTDGAKLAPEQIDAVLAFMELPADNRAAFCDEVEKIVAASAVGVEGVQELRRIDGILQASGIGPEVLVYDATIVRGLDYYTGPVFEVTLEMDAEDGSDAPRRFGTVASGGRYDGLVERFTSEKTPAVGGSIGVDRLLAALTELGRIPETNAACPVLVTIMDKEREADYFALTAELRAAGIPTEVYLGGRNFKQQMKYADARNARFAIIAGSDEFASGEVSVKDLEAGRIAAEKVGEDRDKWVEERPAQVTVKRDELVAYLKGRT